VTQSIVSAEQIGQILLAGSDVLRKTADVLQVPILEVSQRMAQAIRAGNKILVCGNGGSAADSQHFAAELVGRYRRERNAWPAVALTVDTSILTSVGNDYGFDQVFARQVQALGQPEDVLLAISTSGKSPNILHAVEAARGLAIWTVGLTGSADCPLQQATDACLRVPATDTPLIQQAHLAILHVICEALESLVP
jgi:D-sedoheptulose 7-phosphate isomerase